MKIFCLSLIILLAACQTRQDSTTQIDPSASDTITLRDTVYLERNVAITPANSYSDLFLDTTAIDQFITKNNLKEEEQRHLESFYNYRNGQYAWFTSQGFTEQARGFWNLQDNKGSTADKGLQNKMDSLLNNDSLVVSRYDSSILKVEMMLTKAWLQFYRSNRTKTQFTGVTAEKAIPVVRMNTIKLADSILRESDTAMINTSSQYSRLKNKLRRYVTLANDEGFPPLKANSKQVSKGKSSASIIVIKKMMQRTGDMPGTDTTAIFNDSLEIAIKRYQQANGMDSTGKITDKFVKSLNVPLQTRIQQIIINMYRAQWMPEKPSGNYIGVNIPEFMLTVFEENKSLFQIPVAVGKEGTNTTVFTGNLNQVVFSPYWNIPVSIVKNEIMPKMKSNPNYLKTNNMEVVGKNDSIPTIRQKPGQGNAMGRVKFLFPNRYDIYFHDTYNKEIFSRENRALSHGCIRLQDAEKLAVYLLRNDKSWTPEKVHEAMYGSTEKYVKVSPPMPVVITYYTAWVDDVGQLHFREDLYKRDSELAKMLFDDSKVETIKQ